VSGATRVVHVRSAEWAATPESERVYIGRAMPRQGFAASKWGNPFKVLPAHPYMPTGGLYQVGRTAAEAVRLYESHLRISPELLRDLHELRGRVLGCWCRDAKHPNAPCHGDVLARFADATAEVAQ
jgi:hypothetical protein